MGCDGLGKADQLCLEFVQFQGLRFRGLGVQGLRFRVSGLGVSGLRVLGLGVWAFESLDACSSFAPIVPT